MIIKKKKSWKKKEKKRYLLEEKWPYLTWIRFTKCTIFSHDQFTKFAFLRTPLTKFAIIFNGLLKLIIFLRSIYKIPNILRDQLSEFSICFRDILTKLLTFSLDPLVKFTTFATDWLNLWIFMRDHLMKFSFFCLNEYWNLRCIFINVSFCYIWRNSCIIWQ